ncbi:MAG: NAD(P)/FAD-dependent oxidoreductase [Chitinophagales bacterium]|nr:NAD(P)/FAD-dependent oxidoreductase [Chitinophagales bacterium]
MQVIKKKVVIVGVGFAGIGMGIHLKKNGIDDFVMVEAEDGPGGTWRVNTYPGAACDVQSHLYSFSFEPYPNWSRMFGLQEEILQYQEDCCEKYGLYPHCTFDTRVTHALYNDDKGTWTVQTDTGKIYEAQFLVSGTGGLSKPAFPAIKGREKFKGDSFHSAQWNHTVSLKGKRVAIIGSGASAIQIVPSIVDEVAHLDYYQRTPSWVLPKPDRAIANIEKSVFKALPATQQMMRGGIYALMESRGLGFVVSPKIMSVAKMVGIMHINRYIKNPSLRGKVTPDYEMGCKRILMSNDYYQAVAKENVEVITDPIDSIDENGITTVDGLQRNVDVIVYCTGFHASEDVLQYDLKGKNGLDLNDLWVENDPEAYLGTTVSGFPNLFIMVGPNTGLGHNSMIYMIESQINYIIKAIHYMDRKSVQTIDVKPAVQEKYNKEIQARLDKTIWSSGCQSWYLNKNGKNTTLWPGFTFEYRVRTRLFDPNKYEKHKIKEFEAEGKKLAFA